MRSIKTEGALLRAHVVRTARSTAFEIVESFSDAAEAVDELGQRADAVEVRRLHAGRVDEGEACELPCAIVDQEVHAVLGDEDVGGEAQASERVVAEVCELSFVCEAGGQPVDVIARDFAQPRDGVEREEDAQEGQQ